MVAAAPDGSRETQSRDGGPDAFEVLIREHQRMGGTNQFDCLNRLMQKSSAPSVSSAVSFFFDKDGNLTNDGRWKYTWDAENRLTSMAASSGVGPEISLKFEYDSKSRRIRKQVWGNTTWSGSPTNDLKFAYDGWNLVASLNSPSSLLESFLWGLDLSGSVQGAGGVGGLLGVSYYGSSTTNSFVSFDGNGNASALVNAADGTVNAHYEYGPFGELLRATGPMAMANSFRFSTKYQDDETDLLYYGYRCYNASTGGWIGRDPLEERGGVNLYGFVKNDAIDKVDRLGRSIFSCITECTHCGKTYKRFTRVGTGVFQCDRPAGQLGHSYPHAWIEAPSASYSVGFYPGSGNPFGGPGVLESADEASAEAKNAGMTGTWCKEVKVWPCSVDAERFKQRIMTWKATNPFSWYFYGAHDCRHFANYAVAKALIESTYVGDCDYPPDVPIRF